MANGYAAVLQALATFVTGDGQRVVKGDLVRAGHEVTKGREKLFGPLKVRFDYDVKAAEEAAEKAKAAAEAEVKKVASALKSPATPKPAETKAAD